MNFLSGNVGDCCGLMVWGCFMCNGKINIMNQRERLDSVVYQNVLEDNVFLFAENVKWISWIALQVNRSIRIVNSNWTGFM